MRVLAGISVVLVLAAWAVPPEALAHGGQFGHGTQRPWRAPSLPCDCGRIPCPTCSAPGLAEGRDLSRRETRTEVVERWGEVARLRVTTVFRTDVERTFLEASARVEAAPLLAVTGGSVTCVEHDLAGVLAPSTSATRDYLWERDRRLRDPMLVRLDGLGAVTMRVFPISSKGPTTATLEAFSLLAPPGSGAPRLYRTGARFLVVLPRTEANEREADFVDEAGGRVLRFLSETVCRVRFGALVDTALEVPCVDALRDAARGSGSAAVNGATALVALPRGSKAPADLFVGPAHLAPVVSSGPVPPGLREPSDPPPPPPPPPRDVPQPAPAGP
jgi:hypothetical protein